MLIQKEYNMAKKIVSELTSNEFSDFIEEKSLVLVDFYAEWCMPCLMMAPILEGIAQKNPKIKIGKLNVDDASDLAGKFEVSSIPCMIFFKNGKEIGRQIGSTTEDALEEKIASYLK